MGVIRRRMKWGGRHIGKGSQDICRGEEVVCLGRWSGIICGQDSEVQRKRVSHPMEMVWENMWSGLRGGEEEKFLS